MSNQQVGYISFISVSFSKLPLKINICWKGFSVLKKISFISPNLRSRPTDFYLPVSESVRKIIFGKELKISNKVKLKQGVIIIST